MNQRAVPPTTARVARQTSQSINDQIEAQLRRNVLYYAEHVHQIPARLAELDGEWDIERALQANAGVVGFLGMALGFTRNRAYLAVPVLAAGFLFQHAIQGWCPPLPVLRRLGFRTAAEIDRERNALKALRGDYKSVPVGGDAAIRAAHALQAASTGRA